MKILTAGALFPLAALASSAIFGFITDPGCAPCLDNVIANGPGSTESMEFATYLCIGSGGSDAAVCISRCGSTIPFDDPVAIAASEAQVELLMGSLFDYWYVTLIKCLGITPNPSEQCSLLSQRDVCGLQGHGFWGTWSMFQGWKQWRGFCHTFGRRYYCYNRRHSDRYSCSRESTHPR